MWWLGFIAMWLVTESGSTLHMMRPSIGTDTIRAQFVYAQDCNLIAAQMNKVEIARWRCE